jgi:hypothetical protein
MGSFPDHVVARIVREPRSAVMADPTADAIRTAATNDAPDE